MRIALLHTGIILAILLSMLLVGIELVHANTHGGGIYGAPTANFVPLTGIPGVSGTPGLATYINALFVLSITIGALIAVVKIAYAGVLYMGSDIITRKEEAKREIWGAIIGLLILFATYLVLFTINPNLVNLNFYASAPNVTAQPIVTTPTTPVTPVTPPNPGNFTIPPNHTLSDPNTGDSTCVSTTPLTGNTVGFDTSACESSCTSSGGTVTSIVGATVTCNTAPTESQVVNCSTTDPNDSVCNATTCALYSQVLRPTIFRTTASAGVVTYSCDTSLTVGATSIGCNVNSAAGDTDCNPTDCSALSGVWTPMNLYAGSGSTDHSCQAPMGTVQAIGGINRSPNLRSGVTHMDVINMRTSNGYTLITPGGILDNPVIIADSVQLNAYLQNCHTVGGILEVYTPNVSGPPLVYACYTHP